MMKQILLRVCAAWLWCASLSLCAQPAAIQVLGLHNPAHYAGVQIGDVLQRQLRLSVPETETLDQNSLPLKGLQRDGIELRQLQVSTETRDGRHLYTLDFAYQVFAHSGSPRQLQLPAERIAFASGAAYQLPSWRFWFLAQLPDRLQQAKQTLLPQYHAPLLATAEYAQWRLISLLVAIVGLLVLGYRHADLAWLPWMNGPFAKAYRQVKRQPATQAGQQQAVLALQHALNQRFGQHMLASHVDSFVAQHPRFQSMASALHAFFSQANALLYAEQAPVSAAGLQQCKQLARQLRDCERG